MLVMAPDQYTVLKGQLDRIEAHAEATNGRVRALELWQARMQGSASAVKWISPVLTGVVVGVVLHFLG